MDVLHGSKTLFTQKHYT